MSMSYSARSNQEGFSMAEAIQERNERRAIAIAAQGRFHAFIGEVRQRGVSRCSTNDVELCKLLRVYVANNRRKFAFDTVNGELIVGRLQEATA